ncbi:glycoside hydrolase family 26 protein [Streptomyces thermogriseus]|uniref:Glycosyl hydrolase n=1 Tax=Streptomyces thermogriseus TaxID=75292 RepID=A0ABN1T341_9ACTN
MTPERRRARARWLTVGAVLAAASVTLAAGPAPSAGAGRAADARAPVPAPAASGAAAPVPPASPVAPSAPAAPTGADATAQPLPSVIVPGPPVPLPAHILMPLQDTPAFGAFLGSDARGVIRMPGLSHWLGGADLRVGHTYLPGGTWADIEGDVDFLETWAHWRSERPDRMFVLNVPLQERNEENLSDAEVRQLLRQGAEGRFDHHFRALAERLVQLKVPDTILVLGWEMNGITYTHRCGPDPEAWKKYWRRIVTTMRAVPGQKFRFDFTPSRGLDAVPWTQCYPGDDVVDIIGMDSYDQPAGLSFDEQVKEPYGLQAHVDFARAHGKPISYPEWGLFRNGDNPEWMRRMLAWMDEHKPLYNTLSDYCPHGVWRCTDNPRSSEVYRSVLYGRIGAPAAASASTPLPRPAAPPSPRDCTPVGLGDWVEHWIGQRPCIRFGRRPTAGTG